MPSPVQINGSLYIPILYAKLKKNGKYLELQHERMVEAGSLKSPDEHMNHKEFNLELMMELILKGDVDRLHCDPFPCL